MPVVVAAGGNLALEYYLSRRWLTTEKTPDPTRKDYFVLITFKHAVAHFFGPPNDEVLGYGGGHSLVARGLEAYEFCEVRPSSWIHQLEISNRAHPNHSANRFLDLRHYIFPFHDETFECIAEDFAVSISPENRLFSPPDFEEETP